VLIDSRFTKTMDRWPCQYWDDHGTHSWLEDKFINPLTT